MKNYLFLSTLLFVSAHLFAQSTVPAEKPVKTGNEWKMPGDAIARAQNFANDLKKSLGIDDVTSQKVFKAYLDNTKPVDEIPMLPISEDEKKERLKANKIAFNETIKGLLSADQYSKYTKLYMH